MDTKVKILFGWLIFCDLLYIFSGNKFRGWCGRGLIVLKRTFIAPLVFISFVEGVDIRAGIPKWIDEGIFLLLKEREFEPEPLGHLFHGISVQIQSGTFRGAVGGKLGK